MKRLCERRQNSPTQCSPTPITTPNNQYASTPLVLQTDQPHKKYKNGTLEKREPVEKIDQVFIQLTKKTKNLQDLLYIISQQPDDDIKKACFHKMVNAWEKYCFLTNPVEYSNCMEILKEQEIKHIHDHKKIRVMLDPSSKVALTGSFRLLLEGIIHYTLPENK